MVLFLLPTCSYTYTREEAQSICEEKEGYLVEVESKIELDYLTSSVALGAFWSGAKVDNETGIWFWENSGKHVNFVVLNFVREFDWWEYERLYRGMMFCFREDNIICMV